MKRGYTLLIISHGEDRKTRQVFISKRSLRFLSIGSVAIALLFLIFAVHYSTLLRTSELVHSLEEENRKLKKETSRILLLEERLKELSKLRRQVVSMLGVKEISSPSDIFKIEPQSSEAPISAELSKTEDRSSIYIPTGMPTSGIVSRSFSTQHPAIDFAARANSPVIATASGVVIEKKFDQIMGNMIVIDHKGIFRTTYGHLSKAAVNKGDLVKRGDIIGFVGSTGKSTAPHLHYMIEKEGKSVNPSIYITQAKP